MSKTETALVSREYVLSEVERIGKTLVEAIAKAQAKKKPDLQDIEETQVTVQALRYAYVAIKKGMSLSEACEKLRLLMKNYTYLNPFALLYKGVTEGFPNYDTKSVAHQWFCFDGKLVSRYGAERCSLIEVVR